MERLLHYVWKYKLYETAALTTTDGTPIRVIDPGIPNHESGPDFFNARIKARDTVWAGTVEIHEKASDWLLNHHETNRAYDSVILHVTACNDAAISRLNGEPVPQLVLPVPPFLEENIQWLLNEQIGIPCLPYIRKIDALHLSLWLGALIGERLERKTQTIYTLLEEYTGDWNEVFYIILTRAFGFGIHSDAFERLAKSLPFRCIRKQRSSQTQVEALLFGQAGMLEEAGECAYYRLLQREYQFLRYKFSLNPLTDDTFRNSHARPFNFPHLKLAQLAAIWVRHDTLFSAILEARTPREIKSYFRLTPADYWETHYHFQSVSPAKAKPVGEGALNILLINTVVPFLFAYGQRNKLPEYCERAIRLLETIPPERNSIVTMFGQSGIRIANAGDTQALIQLKRAYCEHKKCLYCRIGYQLLKQARTPLGS